MKRIYLLLFLPTLAATACGGITRTSPPSSTPPPAPVPATARAGSASTADRAADSSATALPEASWSQPPPVALPWRPPETGPSRAAQRVLDTLLEPAAVGLPSGLPRGTVTATPANPPRRTGESCYEVQLLVLSDVSAARQAARRAESALSVPARVVASGGFHRVRAGGCLPRSEAEALRERARAAGYSDAFLVEAELR